MILAAAALEEGVVRPTDRFYAENGAITVANATIHDQKKFGWLTFTEVLQNSSNVGSIKVGLSLGKERYYKYISGFGFGVPTGLGLPGESRGQLRPPDAVVGPLARDHVDRPGDLGDRAADGLGVLRGGQRRPPACSRRSSARCSTPRAARRGARFEPRVGSPGHQPGDRADAHRDDGHVVRNGTGHNAAIPGYDVAGKTGTAQKLDPATRRYSRAPGVLSFVGFVPAEDPRLTMLVHARRAQEREVGQRGGRAHLRGIGREALRYLNVPPRDTAPGGRSCAARSAPPAPFTATAAVLSFDGACRRAR